MQEKQKTSNTRGKVTATLAVIEPWGQAKSLSVKKEWKKRRFHFGTARRNNWVLRENAGRRKTENQLLGEGTSEGERVKKPARVMSPCGEEKARGVNKAEEKDPFWLKEATREWGRNVFQKAVCSDKGEFGGKSGSLYLAT